MLSTLHAQAAEPALPEYFVRGIVRDSVTNEVLPMVSVAITGKTVGTLTDEKGIFEMTVPNATRSLTVTTQGYGRKVVPIYKNRLNLYEVRLSPEAETLGEVVIKKKKYSKKNNPAVDLMQRIRATQDVNDPRRNPYYNFEKYERITLGLNNFTEKSQNNLLFKKMPFLSEHVDTSDVSGKPILTLSVKESSSEVHYRNNPNTTREIIHGVKSEGLDEFTDQDNMRALVQQMFREIDLYDKDINLLNNRFVSPLSPLAADFYKFFITDSLEIDGEKAIQLSFYPHNKSAFGFVGQMYVVPSDTAMFIRRVTMRVPHEINLNFIQNMYVDQEFVRAADGSRLKVKDDLVMEIQMVPGMPGMYARRNVAYAGHSFEAPEDIEGVFGGLGEEVMTEGARERDDAFWQDARLIEMPHGESNVPKLLSKLRSMPFYYYTEKTLKILVGGYVLTGKKSKFDIGPVNSFISGNTLEGLRLGVGGMTTANLSKHFFTRFNVARGFRDHKWKYGLELEYSFNAKRYHSREFPMHAIRINSSYDKDQLGQEYLFTNPDNFVLSLKRMEDDRVTYRLINKLSYLLELENHFSFTATVAQERQYSSRLLKFGVTDDKDPLLGDRERPLAHFDVAYGEVEFRYAPHETFYQGKSLRITLDQDHPIITLRHRYGPGHGVFGNTWGVNRTDASYSQRIWFSAWGYMDVLVKGGHVWSRHTPFTQMFIPNANLSYTVQPESFTLMNAMEFVTDSYCSFDLTYWANGAILNYIPLVKKAKLREVFSFRSFWGVLSKRNDPRYNGGMLAFPRDGRGGVGITDASRVPYMEVGVGLDNIFKCLRLDYVWRISHRHPGYKIDREGLRVAFHMTF